MIITALPAPPQGFSSPPAAPEQEADVLTRSPVLLRPPYPRQARAYSRPNTPASPVPPPTLRATSPRGDKREPSMILKSP